MRMLAGNYPQPNGRTTPPPERFTLVNGQPQTIALKYSSGKRVTSRIPGAPDQIMYTLADGRRAYFDLAVAQEIDSLRLAPGQPFTIVKYGPGQWDVQYAHSCEGAAAPPSPRAQAPRPQAEPDLPPHPWPAAPAPAPQRMNGAGEDVAQVMARCYQSAIDIAAAAQEAARGRGLHITASFEDVRCIAATLCINETGGRK